MIAYKLFVLIAIAVVAPSTGSDVGEPCESIGPRNICYMKTTVIDSKDFSITSDRDESVEEFDACNNKQLQHLPNNLGAKFSNLTILRAFICSINEVSKQDFKELGKLRKLHLSNNQIVKIDDDTFEYIPAVEEIWLGGNKIKKLNGRAFASLHKLTLLDLRDNECINKDFFGATRIAELPRVVSERCGFIDNELFVKKIAKLEADLNAHSEEILALKIKNAKLETKLETCDAQIEEKVQEISNFSNDLKAATADCINARNDGNKQGLTGWFGRVLG